MHYFFSKPYNVAMRVFIENRSDSFAAHVNSLLNVLDRADKPLTMLRSIRAMLEPQNGLFLLAVVMPFAAFVEQGTQRVAPTEKLPISGGLCAEGASFEAAASLLLHNVLLPAGFKLRHFSRVPYLCRGDIQQPYYVLSDAIFVLEVDEQRKQDSVADTTNPSS